MNLTNLHLKREWIEDQQILEYTVYTLSMDILQQWNTDLLHCLDSWSADATPLLLFDLSNPNVGMSFFILSGRDLFRLPLVDQQKSDTRQLLHQQQSGREIKLALVLSRTMGSILSRRSFSTENNDIVIGKAFFSRSDAIRWLLTEDAASRDIITQGVNYDDMMKAFDLEGGSGEFYGDQGELRMLVNGSLEIVEIAEGKPVIIGRSKRADLDVTSHGQPALTVSRQHIQIVLHDKRVYVVDLNSRNGTYVSNRQITPGELVLLKRDDAIRIGGLSIVVLF